MPLDLSFILGLTASGLVLVFVLLRIERKWLWLALVFLVGPMLWMLWQWVAFKQAWLEGGLSLALTLLLAGGWWLLIGRKLPPPVSTIKVWGQEAAPKPKPAELQAEIARLKEERDRLEEELRQLKEGR